MGQALSLPILQGIRTKLLSLTNTLFHTGTYAVLDVVCVVSMIFGVTRAHPPEQDLSRADRVGGVDDDGVVRALRGLLHPLDAVRDLHAHARVVKAQRHLHAPRAVGNFTASWDARLLLC